MVYWCRRLLFPGKNSDNPQPCIEVVCDVMKVFLTGEESLLLKRSLETGVGI
jgi:hypothetical protein